MYRKRRKQPMVMLAPGCLPKRGVPGHVSGGGIQGGCTPGGQKIRIVTENRQSALTVTIGFTYALTSVALLSLEDLLLLLCEYAQEETVLSTQCGCYD